MNERQKSKIYDHLGLKFLALVISTFVWFVVMNVEDSTTIKTISGIEVEMQNGDSIIENGNVYDITDGEVISVVVQGPRSLVENLSASNFTATADLSHLSITNSTTIKVVTNSSVRESDAKKLTITPVDEYVTLSIEHEVEKSVPVKVITTGSVAEGYALGTATSTPNMVTVRGPGSVVSNIVEARAVVDVNGSFNEIQTSVGVGCIDGYGAAIEKNNISLSVEQVKVSIPVYQTKEIPINVSTVGNPHEGFGVFAVNYEPSTIVIAGEEDALEEVEGIDVKDVLITDATDTIEKNINLDEYLPSGVFVANSDANEVAISVDIVPYSEVDITLNKGDIGMEGMVDTLEYTIKGPETLKVKITGFEDNIKEVQAKDLGASISLGDKGPGDHEVEVTFKESELYQIKDSYKVNVEVKKKE